MDELLRQLLNRLDAVQETNEELSDSECRDQMSRAIHHAFLVPDPNYVLPDEFGLYTDEGNRAVKAALAAYIREANAKCAELGIHKFHDRLAAFQAEDVVSDHPDEPTYNDDYFGWANPQDFDESGKFTGGSGRWGKVE